MTSLIAIFAKMDVNAANTAEMTSLIAIFAKMDVNAANTAESIAYTSHTIE